jgi:hypothetical protein
MKGPIVVGQALAHPVVARYLAAKARKSVEGEAFAAVLQGPPGKGRMAEYRMRNVEYGMEEGSSTRSTVHIPGPAFCHSSSSPKRHADETPDPLDPEARRAAQMGPPPMVAPGAVVESAPVEKTARVSLEEILPAVLRRIAWSGDARRGAVRLEIGTGMLAGATVLIQADDGRLRVTMHAPPGVDAEAWRERLRDRFARKKLDVESIVVE